MKHTPFFRIAALLCAAMLLCFPLAGCAAGSGQDDPTASATSRTVPAAVSGAGEAGTGASGAVRAETDAESTQKIDTGASGGSRPAAAPEDGAGSASEAAAEAASNAVLPCPNYDPLWLRAWLADPEPLDLPEDLSGLLGASMPHYAPMMKLGASLLRAAAEDRSVETVVILAPNHEGIGPAVELSGLGYYWADGSIEGDADAAAFLREASAVDTAEDRRVLDTEYAASLWAPYIAEIFPGARVVTVLFTRGVQTEELGRLADALTALAAQKDIFILCSIDFSHYQTPDVMAARDRVTRSTAASGDIPALRQLDGTYLDCPEALSVLLLCGELRELAYRTLTYSESGRAVGASYFLYGSFAR